jgi:hypothetical protein
MDREISVRHALIIFLIATFCQTARSAEDNPLKGLDGVQFSSSVETMREVTITKERVARTAEDALKKAGILRKGDDASAYPELLLTVRGGKKQDVVVFVWELQVKEKVSIPANQNYRRTAFQGSVIIWETSGMMTTNPAKMELDLVAQIQKAVEGFVKKWREANTVATSSERTHETKK